MIKLNLFILVLSYLLGSIPFSHIFPRLKGKHVGKEGTKNIGATNAMVVAGPLMGALALAGDILKGYLPVFIGLRLNCSPWIIALTGLLAIAGHDFSVFFKFKGGKGVATTGGVLLALDPIFAIILLLILILTMLITQYLIPSTILILTLLPLMLIVLGKDIAYVFWSLGALILALYCHRKDIKRFLNGEELRLNQSINRFLKK